MMVWKKKKKKKFFFFFVFSHSGGSVSLPGVRELGWISGRLPDDPGGFTCMTYIEFIIWQQHFDHQSVMIFRHAFSTKACARNRVILNLSGKSDWGLIRVCVLIRSNKVTK